MENEFVHAREMRIDKDDAAFPKTFMPPRTCRIHLSVSVVLKDDGGRGEVGRRGNAGNSRGCCCGARQGMTLRSQILDAATHKDATVSRS